MSTYQNVHATLNPVQFCPITPYPSQHQNRTIFIKYIFLKKLGLTHAMYSTRNLAQRSYTTLLYANKFLACVNGVALAGTGLGILIQGKEYNIRMKVNMDITEGIAQRFAADLMGMYKARHIVGGVLEQRRTISSKTPKLDGPISSQESLKEFEQLISEVRPEKAESQDDMNLSEFHHVPDPIISPIFEVSNKIRDRYSYSGNLTKLSQLLQSLPTQNKFQILDRVLHLLDEKDPSTSTFAWYVYSAIQEAGLSNMMTPSKWSILLKKLKHGLNSEVAGRMLEVLNTMRALGNMPSKKHYDQVLYTLARFGLPHLVIKVMEDMEADQIRPNITSFMLACHRSDNLHLAQKVFDDRLNTGMIPQWPAYHVLISGYVRKGDLCNALKIFQLLKNNYASILDHPVGATYIYTSIIQGYCKAGEVTSAAKTFDEMIQRCNPSEVTFNTLIDGYGKQGNMDEALYYFKRMRAYAGIPPSKFTYTSLIVNLLRLKDTYRANKYYSNMITAGCLHDMKLLTAIVYLKVCENEMDASEKIVEIFEPSGTDINNVAYHHLMHGYAKNLNLDKAILTFQRLKTHGHETNVYTFTILVDALIRSGLTLDAIEMIDRMKHLDIDPSATTFSALIAGCARLRESELALKILDRMIQGGIHLNQESLTSVMALCIHTNDFSGTLKAFNQIIAMGMKPSCHSYTTLISGYTKQRKMKSAIEVLKRMIMDGVQPNSVTFTALIQGYGIMRDAMGAMRMWQTMIKAKIQPNEWTVWHMERALRRGKMHEKDVNNFKEAVENSVTKQETIPWKRRYLNMKREKRLGMI